MAVVGEDEIFGINALGCVFGMLVCPSDIAAALIGASAGGGVTGSHGFPAGTGVSDC